MNFIVGLNGSGKSSILTAIIVGLGGRAALTCRGNSTKNLIQRGKRVAEVSVRLRNCGADAYRHDVYGDAIVIQRKLTVDNAGQHSYRICSADNRVVSTDREELSAILDYFNIQVIHIVMNMPAAVHLRLHASMMSICLSVCLSVRLSVCRQNVKNAIFSKTKQ